MRRRPPGPEEGPRPRGPRRLLSRLAAAGVCVLPRCAAAVEPSSAGGGVSMDPLRGEYGFLSEFDGISEADARARVRRMVELFGVREFQFYDAFEGYSRPPRGDAEHWYCACLHKPVNRSILRAYTEEIARVGGRSWLSVQAMATDLGDVELQAEARVLGHHDVGSQPLLDVVGQESGPALG